MHYVGEELHKRGIKSDTETSKAQLTLQIIQKNPVSGLPAGP